MNKASKISGQDAQPLEAEAPTFRGAEEYQLLNSEGEDLGAAIGSVALKVFGALALGIVAAALVLR